jgi:phage terminase small subunit
MHTRKAAIEKRARFVREFCKTLNGQLAAERAGWAKGATARVEASKMLNDPAIAAEVKRVMSDRMQKAELSATRVLEELRRLSFSDVRSLFTAKGELRPLHTLTEEEAACIASVEVVMKNATAGDGKIDRVLKIKTWDKTRSLEMLAKHFKLLTEVIKHEGLGKLDERVAKARARLVALKAARGKA